MTTRAENLADNAHGQLTALVAAIRGILDVAPGFRPFVASRLEGVTALALGSGKSGEVFIDGIHTVMEALLANPPKKIIQQGAVMQEEQKEAVRKEIAALEAQLSPLDVYEFSHFGNKTKRGRRAAETIERIWKLEESIGERLSVVKAA
jgi:hypothetical protein